MRLDYVLVGGGLQNALCALAILARRPDTRLALVERDALLGGNHTWCFHAGDVPAGLVEVIASLVVRRWSGYQVAFPGLSRTLDHEYAAISSQRLDAVVSARLAAAPGVELLTGVAATSVRAGQVTLADGRRLEAQVVVDARGPRAGDAGAASGCAWQKFLGLEIRLARPSAPELPMIMDATVAQEDGYRFVYVLPLAPDRVLVEDTYFSDDPRLDVAALEPGLRAYAAAHGWPIAEVVRREAGVLPLPWTSPEGADEPPFETTAQGTLVRGGFAGGWFHPTTGYSFPVAARLAAHVAARAPEAVVSGLAALYAAHRRQARFAERLNRLLFRHFAPAERWNVLARFYRLPEATVRRFYALELGTGDKARILCGRPPRGMKLFPAALSPHEPEIAR